MMQIYLIFILYSLSFVSSFILDKAPAPLSGLRELVEAQHEKRVSVGLKIGDPEGNSILAINGLVFDFTKEIHVSKNDFISMPGKHWPWVSFTGGLRELRVVEDGSFISMRGNQIVKPLKGCWELVWRKGDPDGTLTFGLELDQVYKRNDATLPKGMIYISLTTWSSEGLKNAQSFKKRSTERADMALKKRDEEIFKMNHTTNIFQKGLHYYKALCAFDEYLMEPNLKMRRIPSEDEVVHLEGDLYICKSGKVWTHDSPMGKQATIGTVSLELLSKKM